MLVTATAGQFAAGNMSVGFGPCTGKAFYRNFTEILPLCYDLLLRPDHTPRDLQERLPAERIGPRARRRRGAAIRADTPAVSALRQALFVALVCRLTFSNKRDRGKNEPRKIIVDERSFRWL